MSWIGRGLADSGMSRDDERLASRAETFICCVDMRLLPARLRRLERGLLLPRGGRHL